MERILVVEDDPVQRLLYEVELGEEGYDVVLARDGLEALEQVRNEAPDLIVLDILMPHLHGLDTLRKLVALHPNLPVIIHSAYSHYKDDHSSWVAEEYVVKSSDLSGLKNAIKRALKPNQAQGHLG